MSDFQVMPPLDPATDAALRASIERFGVLVPVVRDQHGRILDGHHRDRIAKALGVVYETTTVRIDDDDHAREVATTLNEDRRHLPPEQRREVVVALREQGHSLRAIAGAIGVSKSQVAKDTDHLSTGGQVESPDRITGLDGKRYPANPSGVRNSAHAEALAEFPELAPDKSPGLPKPVVVQIAKQLRAIPEGPEREEARAAAATYHRVYGKPSPEEEVAAQPSIIAQRAVDKLDEFLRIVKKAGGVEAIVNDLDESPLAQTMRALWIDFLTESEGVICDWRARMSARSLRRIK